MVVGEFLEILLLLGSGQLCDVSDGSRVWRFRRADEHLRDVPGLVEGLVVQSLVAFHHSGEVHQLGGKCDVGMRY